MDVRSIEDVSPVIEHNGTVPVWWLVPPGEMLDATRGGFLELVSEWVVEGGGLVDPHAHPTHEFYYILGGRGVMKIADEEREVRQGDLVYIPPNATHSIWPATKNAPLRGLAFAIGMKDAGPVDYTH
jgi:mannose-6-phosphate isomerase-like protein (cupin superfamily)